MSIYTFIFVFTIFLSHFHQSKPTTLKHSTDLESLLAFKSHITDPYNNIITNWTTDTSFCNWVGVTCGAKHKRVVSLDLFSFSLQECRALSMVRHRNLVKIISTCSNTEFKALILQFMSNGTLDQWLHSEDKSLNLLQRINIMIDVSLALEYLHHHHHNIVVHCDLKPSNVLLDENIVAYVSDFGIAKILAHNSKSFVSANAPGTIGYIAPEYAGSGNVTRRSDVYSFGILILETITGKRPTNAMFHAELSLRQWTSNAYPDAVLDIIDSKTIRDDYVNATQIEVQKNFHQCLASIIELGLLCSCDSPEERMLMKDVVPRLQKIKLDYLSTLPYVVEDRL